MNNTKKHIPVHVYVLLVFFWPVGLFFLYRHLTEDKTNLMHNSQVLRNFGIGFVVFGATAIIGCLSDASYLAIPILFIAGGVLMLYQANQLKLRTSIYRHYIDLTVNNGVDSFSSIADAMRLSPQVVETDLQKMIDIGFFADAYLDKQSGRIILPRKSFGLIEQQQVVPSFINAPTSFVLLPSGTQTAAVPRVLRCKYCGANNVIKPGAVEQCEYCDSPL